MSKQTKKADEPRLLTQKQISAAVDKAIKAHHEYHNAPGLLNQLRQATVSGRRLTNGAAPKGRSGRDR